VTRAWQACHFSREACHKGVSSYKKAFVYISFLIIYKGIFFNLKNHIIMAIKAKIIKKTKPGNPEEKYYCAVPLDTGITKYYDFVMKICSQTKIHKSTVGFVLSTAFDLSCDLRLHF